MQELEKILEEIDIKIAGSMGKKREGLLEAREIIRKHMNEKVTTNDLISRQALLDDFRNTITENSDTFDWLNMIARQPTVNKGDSWITVEDRLPEDGTDVLVVLKPTYESDYIEYSIARCLRFENDEAHWCDNHYGYLEWEKYSDGHGGSSWYRVVAWQKLDSYHPERSDNHDGE